MAHGFRPLVERETSGVMCAGERLGNGSCQVDGRGLETDFGLFVLSGFRAEIALVP